MAGDFEVDVDMRGLVSFTRNLERLAQDLLQKAAMDTASGASGRTVRVDTGTMKNSWSARNVGYLEWVTGSFGCEYAIYHELGTSRFPASPMLYPSFVEQFNMLKRAIGA